MDSFGARIPFINSFLFGVSVKEITFMSHFVESCIHF